MAITIDGSLSIIVPTSVQVPYTPPALPTLLALSAFFILLSLPTLLSSPDSYTLNPSLTLLLPLLIGALLGPSITSASIMSEVSQRTLIDIGYIGLLLLIFEAGVSLDPASLELMRKNAGLSLVVAMTGVGLPFAFSMALEVKGYGYRALTAFASGASLSSTSLGTTLALLAPSGAVDLKRTRVGCVLVCAALLDDILGLVIAGIIPGLADAGAAIQWQSIVRPIGVSLAFGICTPILAIVLRKLVGRLPSSARRREVLCVVMALVLLAFVAGSGYAGTSELFGAYLAGALVGHVFNGAHERENIAHAAFCHYLQPVLIHFLAPIFFASIGTALPIKAMFTTYPHAVQVVTTHMESNLTTTQVISGAASHRVVWRGIIYSILMVLAKMAVGLWMLIWPASGRSATRSSVLRIEKTPPNVNDKGKTSIPPSGAGGEASEASVTFSEPSRVRSALLLGVAMVARGEIALIIAQLARPLLVDSDAPSSTVSSIDDTGNTAIATTTPVPDEEAFAVVIWAVLVSTVVGALGVGVLLAVWKKRDKRHAQEIESSGEITEAS